MELDAHAMDRYTSVLHSTEHADDIIVLACAPSGTVVIVEEERVWVSCGSVAEGIVNVIHAHSTPGFNPLQEIIAVVINGLVDDVPS